jgi:hypothetical protein
VSTPPRDAGGRPSGGGPDHSTATNGGTSIADGRGEHREVGELLGAWLDIRMATVDDLVAEARSRVDAIPDLRTLWLLTGEILVRLAAAEHELAELRKAPRR